jgi:mRNA interferase MazF
MVGKPARADWPAAGIAPFPRPPYAVRNAVIVAFLTTTIRTIPVEVKLTPADGVPRDCVINLDLVNTIPKSALAQRICALSDSKLVEVSKAIRFALAL